MDLNVVRKFRFKLQDEVQEVALAHWENIWQVIVNGAFRERQSHKTKDNSGQMSFEVNSPSGVKLPAKIECTWDKRAVTWIGLP